MTEISWHAIRSSHSKQHQKCDMIPEATCTVWSHDEARRQHTSSPGSETCRGCHVGYRPNAQWRRPPGRPHNSWLQQINNGSLTGIRPSWRDAKDQGHHGLSPLLPELLGVRGVYHSRCSVLETRLTCKQL